MAPHWTSGSSSIFEDGKLKPGTYKIQNLFSETYLDIHQHSKQVCCRPAKVLEEGRGLVSLCLPFAVHESDNWKWEIKSLGAGYAVQRVSLLVLLLTVSEQPDVQIEPGTPGQFCTPMNGLNDGVALFVNAYPTAWRIEIVNDDVHRGYEYVRSVGTGCYLTHRTTR